MSVSIIGKNCCACKTCEQVCAVRAISFKTDLDGYEQVSVDGNVCIACGLCEKVCPILTVRKPYHPDEPDFCGAAYAIDDDAKEKGSSGGLFSVFAQHVIEGGGVVYGAAFDKALQLKTARATTKDELLPLYKSKYLLCDTGNSFSQIKEDLQRGKTVLYCATPCQIAGLQAYLRVAYDLLICVEFACHGVGSQQQFDQSIKYLETRKKIHISHFEFRHKMKHASSSHYFMYDGTKQGKPYRQEGLYLLVPYYNAYCKQWLSREICYRCPYATGERNADITIGDFHTIGKILPRIDRFKGVSMFLCNTSKGRVLFDAVKDRLTIYPMSWDVIKHENRFSGGGPAPKEREDFLLYVRTEGYDAAVSTMLNPLRDWKRLIYYHLPSFVRKKLTGQ